jgi:hypothetical protein
MRLLVSLLILSGLAAGREGYQASGAGWQAILEPIGMLPSAEPRVLVAGTEAKPEDLRREANAGAIVVVTGESAAAKAFGFLPGEQKVTVRSVVDTHAPELWIVWEKALDVRVTAVPANAELFARERWTGAPMVAGFRLGDGAVLWLAAEPGDQGYNRFPYLPQALARLGYEPPYRASRLWAFFDGSYRRRIDFDYFAERWRRSGIAALHVAAWHFYDRSAESDAYLQGLIEACHRRQIQVYAWLELPHVSEKFWQDHPEWREQTAAGQDAHLDWRKLMSLQHPDCRRAVREGVGSLLKGFDWDGVNVAELYFESLEGAANPARFTPYHPVVRERFGKDPAAAMPEFLQFRAKLAEEMQREWLGFVAKARPGLDVVLTHVDDRFDRRMRDLIGADAARVLPLLEEQPFTFLIEDPATVWHLGPERYPKIAEQYAPLTRHRERLAIDLNIVERYQDVYPTKQQTGVELFRLVQLAAQSFERVALYFENSLLKQDLGLLPTASATVSSYRRRGDRVEVETRLSSGVRWTGGAKVNGQPWAAVTGDWVTVPAGQSIVQPGPEPPVRLLDLNGELVSARWDDRGIDLAYRSNARGYARFSDAVMVDGRTVCRSEGECVVELPAGDRQVRIQTAANWTRAVRPAEPAQ